MGKKQNKKIVTYSEFIKELHLKHFYQLNITASRNEVFSLPAKIHIKNEAEFKNEEKNILKVYTTYKLTATEKGKKEPGMNISVAYLIIYSSKIKMSEEYFEKFSKSSLIVESWPYFRNLVHELTMRMGLPSLVLDVFHYLTKSNKKAKKDDKD